ncbi:MAG: barstar family protein [Bryobacterales bacterium]|nr:barstar family protein [Acidobacteriota bacterium]MCB9384058.1 barstar family protein [Bryobacterales bacterium]
MSKVVEIDTERIVDWESFHDVFQWSLGFPDFYGRNLNAWIDCMTSLDVPADRLTTVHVSPGEVLVLRLSSGRELSSRHPDLYAAIVESSAFVNYRRLEVGESAVLALAFP